MRKLVLHTETTEKSAVVIENGVIQEYVLDRPGAEALAGSLYAAKVRKVDQGLQAAFLDIGEEKSGFLRRESIPRSGENIQSVLREGESLIVQVIKEPLGEKGPQVTADVTIPGLNLIYQPFGGKVVFSRKLKEEDRARLEGPVLHQIEDGEGVIVRTGAAEAAVNDVCEELCHLRRKWESVLNGRTDKSGKLFQESLIPDQLLRKFPVTSIKEIVFDSGTPAKEARERYPSLSPLIRWSRNLSEELPVSLDLLQQQMLSDKVEIGNGTRLNINQTEAMVIIDVNSSTFKGRAFSNSQALQVNLEAVPEIQRQIRLRNLSGIIIVDFLSMKDQKSNARLIAEMKKALRYDPVHTTVLGLTKLGLLEMTRKREGVRLPDLLAEQQSPSFTMETAVYRLERELIDSKGDGTEAKLLVVNPLFHNEKKRLLSGAISSKIPQELFVREDSQILHYQIELEGSLNMIRDAVQRRGYHVDNLF
ncbi:ribonuclease E/G [Halobacillus sp. KGW1]|uniref:ribonuclease E/G n=1 Tax=Halobacillus sp. KGW1 TaxID=1793726 RepID=UPI001372B2FA|nr:ribonuclease E/G [Halobacillus sp. KGW1]